MIAPLFGQNLVRLIYLDETGTTSRATFLSVAGVILHGDYEWPGVDERIVALIERYIPEPDRLGFVFHATDIFHGSGYFDRRKPEWETTDQRWPILLASAGADPRPPEPPPQRPPLPPAPARAPLARRLVRSAPSQAVRRSQAHPQNLPP
jgi:hypothetical protein